MKLCLLIATAVVIATSYALPVPKEEVFTVYPVNSAMSQEPSNLPAEAKPEQQSTPADGALAKDLSNEKKVEVTEKVDDTPVESKPEEVKTVSEKVSELTSVMEEATKPSDPVPEAKSAPLTESSDAKVEEAAATVAPKEDDASTTVASNEELRLVVSESVVATEPKVAVPETVAEVPKSVEELPARSVGNETAAKAEEQEPAGKSVESVKVEETKEEKSEPKAVAIESEVKTVVEEMSEKLTEELKAEVAAEPSLVRSVTEEKVMADQVAVKSDVEPTTEKQTVVEKAQESVAAAPEVVPASAADEPVPQTEGVDEVRPTKVRAAPIVEGLKVSQPVEAEPATVAKIHVTVIQEEVMLDGKNAPQKEAVSADEPAVTEVEEKSTEAATTTTVAAEQEVKSETKALETVPETKDAVSNDKLSEVKSVDGVVESKAEAPKPAAVSKEAESKSTPEAVVIVMPSVKSEDATTVVAVAENTDKPAETAEDKAVPEVRSAGASDELPEPATTAKAEEQQAKAAEGSSQPGASESSDTVQEDAQDQSDSVSTTVSIVTEQDTTTVSPVTTTEPESVPTPAKQKAKKQVPPNLKGYSKRLKLQEAQRKQSTDSE
ncbi:proteoglycan 4-like [Anopheles merus]|nr:proteoglycan 4-like [Anopheles merus]XP_041777280.1 proteoglycan 4-like [Anopheles merus]